MMEWPFQPVHCQDTRDLAEQARLLQTLGQYYADQGETTKALDQYKQALTAFEGLEDKDGMLATLDALATITSQADDAEGALVYAVWRYRASRLTGR